MGHREKYLINGVEAPSVTQILGVIRKPFLENWRGRYGNAECDRIMMESQELGHRFHAAIEAYYQGHELPELGQREAEMFALFRGWALESKFEPTELELHLESKKHHYHGTVDTFGRFEDGVIVVGDWKTSSSISSDYGMQLAAYAAAFNETTGANVTEGFILRVDKKPGAKKPLEVKRFSNLPKYFEVFMHCKQVFDFANKKGAWKSDL
jgi:CRISPR/Cas system-associated exonuclease Cas4 (RecB family)